MTAKELRQAAEYAVTQWDRHDSKRLVQGEEAFLNEDGEPDTVSFARHILSTVRDDDDEPVTEQKFLEFATNGLLFLNGSSDWFLYWRDGVKLQVETDGHNESICETKNLGVMKMGQFRSLCRGLGIVLEENVNEN